MNEGQMMTGSKVPPIPVSVERITKLTIELEETIKGLEARLSDYKLDSPEGNNSDVQINNQSPFNNRLMSIEASIACSIRNLQRIMTEMEL